VGDDERVRMTRLYVAGPWAHKAQVNIEAQKYRDAGYTVDCHWLTLEDDDEIDFNATEKQSYYRALALKDVEEVLHSDAFIIINSKKSEGKCVELGLAIALIKPVLLIGPRTNIFHTLNIPRFDTVEESIVWMEEQEATRKVQLELANATEPVEVSSV